MTRAPRRDPRRTNGSARRRLRDRVASLGLPCALCGRPIDYALPAFVVVDGRRVYNPWAYELDEMRPVSRWREFGYASPQACALDPDNVQPTHRICNERAGDKRRPAAEPPPPMPSGVTRRSREW